MRGLLTSTNNLCLKEKLEAVVSWRCTTWPLQEDLKPLMRELLNKHPGLEFLHDTPEFQDRYGKIRPTSVPRGAYDTSSSCRGDRCGKIRPMSVLKIRSSRQTWCDMPEPQDGYSSILRHSHGDEHPGSSSCTIGPGFKTDMVTYAQVPRQIW